MHNNDSGSDCQNLQVLMDFDADCLPMPKSRFTHDYSLHKKITVEFANGQKKELPLGALAPMSKPENYRVALRNGALTMVYKPHLEHKEKTWDGYISAIQELRANQIPFTLSPILYPWVTFKAECMRQFINKKLTYKDIREALK